MIVAIYLPLRLPNFFLQCNADESIKKQLAKYMCSNMQLMVSIVLQVALYNCTLGDAIILLFVLWFACFKNRGKLPDGSKLLEADDIIKLKRCILGAKVGLYVSLVCNPSFFPEKISESASFSQCTEYVTLCLFTFRCSKPSPHSHQRVLSWALHF